MKLNEAITKNLTNYHQQEALKYADMYDIGKLELPDSISELIHKFNNNESIEEKEILLFKEELTKFTNDNLYDAIIGIINSIALKIYEAHKSEIAQFVMHIENQSKADRPLAQEDLVQFKGLLNIYRITNGTYLNLRVSYTWSFPGMTDVVKTMFLYDLPFAINVLLLTCKLPENKKYHELDLSKPLYPAHLKVSQEEKLPIRRGIKDSDAYYPYKRVFKIVKGDTGDNTIMATNGKKTLYIRAVEKYAPNAILASKIASFISKKHFSSERLLSNLLAGSKKQVHYCRSFLDRSTFTPRRDYLAENNNVFPGSGLIDEVLNFICERDRNFENIGFSSSDVPNSHLVKIDFDCCDVSNCLRKNDYEKNIILNTIYNSVDIIKKRQAYSDEHLYARLKLSLLSRELISAWVEKAYIYESERQLVIEEQMNRTELALQLFLTCPDVIPFLNRNKDIINDLFEESIKYIESHFDEDKANVIIEDMKQRAEKVSKMINNELDVTFHDLRIVEQFSPNKLL